MMLSDGGDVDQIGVASVDAAVELGLALRALVVGRRRGGRLVCLGGMVECTCHRDFRLQSTAAAREQLQAHGPTVTLDSSTPPVVSAGS